MRHVVLWFRCLPPSGGDAERVGHSHQIDHGLRLHLSHDLAAMDLSPSLARFRLSRNLFVVATGHDESQDFWPARRQGIEALAQFRHHVGLLPPGTIVLDPRLDGTEQLIGVPA